MDRSRARTYTAGIAAHRAAGMLLLMAVVLLSAGGCVASMLATGIYVLQGGNVVPAECDALKGQRVVVVCRPPASHEYRHAGASRALAQRVSEHLVENVKGIDVVNPREVDNWIDESDWGDFRELARALRADRVVHVELESFDLFKGKTLYQGNAEVSISVYDMKDNSRLMWQRHLGEVLYPTNSGIPAQDKPVQQFEREFVGILAQQIAERFYKHEPNALFAMDALANR